VLVVFLLIAGLTLAFANGANDNFKATATLYGSGELDFDASRRLATFAQIAGSLASLFWAQALLRSFGGKGLVPDAVVADPLFLIAVGSGAAATVLLATRVGLPVSTTHALVGGLIGAGVCLSPSSISWSALGGSFVAPLLASPLLALIAASSLYPLAQRLRRRYGIETSSCLCIGPVQEPVQLAADGTLVLARTGLALALDETARCRDLYAGSFLGLRLQSIAERLHQGSAFALGFARGLNDTPKVLALVVTAGWSGLDPRLSLAAIAVTMAAGGWLRAERVAETLSHRITPLRPGPGLLANSVASLLVIGASLAGSPVSTTHVSTGAIVGVGLRNDTTDWKVVRGIVSAWIGTLPLAAALAAAVALVASHALA
jgi:inorganic phosphate transporter, PiT family